MRAGQGGKRHNPAGHLRLADRRRERRFFGYDDGGRSSAGRAPDCDSGRRGFESHRPPHLIATAGTPCHHRRVPSKKRGFCSVPTSGMETACGVRPVPTQTAAVAAATDTWMYAFDGTRRRTRGPLAQLVEQLTLNQLVVGSIPTRPTTFPFSNPIQLSLEGEVALACG